MIAAARERDCMIESNSVRSCAVCAVRPVRCCDRLAREVHYNPDYVSKVENRQEVGRRASPTERHKDR